MQGPVFTQTHRSTEHAQDLAALIAHDALLFLIVQDRHREPARVVLIGFEVDLPQVREVIVQRVRDHVLALGILVFGGREAPSCHTASAHVPHSRGHLHRLPFSPRCQCTEDTVTKSSSPFSFLAMIALVACGRCSVSWVRGRWVSADTHPGARVADVQVIPPLLGRELGPGLVRDPVAERADLPLELAALVRGVHPVRDLSCGRLRVSC